MSHDRKLVPFDRGRRRPDPARVHEFAATARRLQREREESSGVVERVLRTTPRAEWPTLAERDELRTMGVLEQLSKEVSRRLERDPLDALAISNVATIISETLPQDLYPAVVTAQARAHAWKDRAQSLSCLARYTEALQALDRAEAQLEPFGTVAHDRALITYVRATTLLDAGRLNEGIVLLRECAAVFSDHGDLRLQLYCGIVEAAAQHRRCDFKSARDVLTSLIAVATAMEDRGSEARIRNNLGHALVELGDYSGAELQLAEAIALFNNLGWRTEATKAAMACGRMFVRKGDLARGMARLYDARREFLLFGMVEEAGLCGLDVVDALIMKGAPAEAEALAREIIDEFTSAALNTRAITALGYLREAIAARAASTTTVDNVRHYIAALRKDPEREFVPLAM